jgi:surface polysaccharide O-acyltransferase-like enzyme
VTKRLFWLNGIAILAVVLNHAVGWGFTAMFWWTDRYRDVAVPNFDAVGSPTYYILVVLKQLTPIAVPIFLVVSGYFIGFASRAGLNWKMIWARLKSILIPYLIWSVVTMALDMAFGTQISPLQFVVNLVSGNASPVYYYVPLICQLFVLSLVLVPLVRSENWKKVLAAAAILQAIMLSTNYLDILNVFGDFALDVDWFFGNLVFFFVFGLALNFHLEEIRGWLIRTRYFWLAALILFSVAAVVETEVYFELKLGDWRGGVETLAATLYTISFLMVFIAFDNIQFPYAALLGKVGQKSYGIYLMHPIVLMLTAKAIYHLIPAVLAWQGLFVPLLMVFGLAVPLVLMRLVARTPLRIGYHYLFG